MNERITRMGGFNHLGLVLCLDTLFLEEAHILENNIRTDGKKKLQRNFPTEALLLGLKQNQHLYIWNLRTILILNQDHKTNLTF